MKKEDIFKIVNKNGLHARPSVSFVRLANKFESQINVEYDGELYNGKSVLGIMMMGVSPGQNIKIIADGNDADRAVEELGDLVKSGFNED